MNAGNSTARTGIRTQTLAALLLAAAQAPLGSTMIAVALPAMSRDLGADLALVTSLVVTSYLIVSIIGQAPGGKIGDVFGYSRAARLGILMYALGAATGLVGTNLVVLVIARGVMALGGALVVPSTVALLRVHTPPERRGRVFGVVGATMGLAAAIGPPLGGELVHDFGWRAIFGASLIPLAVAALMERVWPAPGGSDAPVSARDLAKRFDGVGTALLGVGLALLVGGSKLTGATRFGTMGAALAVLVLFTLFELRTKDPVLDPRLFGIRAFAAGTSIVALQNFAMYGLLFELPAYFSEVRGATAAENGRALFVMMLGMFSMSLIGGRLVDRAGPRLTALFGASLALGGMLWASRVRTFQAPGDALGALVLLGLGLGLCNSPSQSSAMSAAPQQQAGMAAGVSMTMRYLGGVLGILMLSVLLGGGGVRDVGAHETAISAFTVALVAALGLCALLPSRALVPART